ncbi:MAG TPA: hypothetical protein VKT81_12220 [Bryobacteraceae bacterium]|nr:hypothetical protein [Bryobacteraceae bacterium]
MLRLELTGALSAANAAELERVWRTGSSTLGARALVVGLNGVTSADDAGRRLLARWKQLGATFVAESDAARAIALSIPEGPVIERKAAGY